MYRIRTDLALETKELNEKQENLENGINMETIEETNYSITRIKVLNKEGSENLHKPVGTYITIDVPSLNKSDQDLKDEISQVLAKELIKIHKTNHKDKILIIGLGNWNITPDALGPKVVERVLVTRQFFVNYRKESDLDMINVAALSPGVMGMTGIETGEIVKGIVEKIQPSLVIAVDALASRKLNRVSTTIQISNTGINPGAGVGNNRMELNEKTLGVPVLAIGVPTVVDAATIVNDTLDLILESLKKEATVGTEFYKLLGELESDDKYTLIRDVLNPYVQNVVVTPTDIDLLIDDLSVVIANGLNIALHPGIKLEDVNRYIK